MAHNPSNPPPHQMSSASAIISDARQNEVATSEQETNAAVKKSKATKCNECNIILNSEEQARSHYGGKSHQNRLKELGISVQETVPLNHLDASHASKATECTACKLTLNSEAQALQHYKGKSHLNRIKELELNSNGRFGMEGGGRGEGGVSVQSNAAAFQAGTTSTVCTTCDVTLNSGIQVKQHFEGKSHQMKCRSRGVISPAHAPFPVKVDSFVTKGAGIFPSRAPQMINFCQPMPIDNGRGSNPFAAVKPLGVDQVSSGSQPIQGAPPTDSQKRKAPEVSCTACLLLLNSETQAELHFSSKRHIKRMKMQQDNQEQWNSVLIGDTPELTPRRNRFFCQQCQLSVNSSSQLAAHMLGQQHRSKLQMGQHPYAISTVGQPGELSGMPTNVWTEVPGNKNGWFYCRQCNISVPTAVNLSQHVQSSGHIQQKFQSYDVDGSHDCLDNSDYPTWNEEPSQYYNNFSDYPNYVQF